MFDQVSEAAEKVATNVSRRAFLGRLGQGALAAAGVLGGMLAFGGEAQASSCYGTWCPPGYHCCGSYRFHYCWPTKRCGN